MKQKEIRKARKLYHGIIYVDVRGVKRLVIQKNPEKLQAVIKKKCPPGKKLTSIVSAKSRNEVRDRLVNLAKNRHRKE